MIVSEELRTKVTILSELLEQRIKDAGLGKKLKLQNSSKEMTNVDIFIELNKLQKILAEKDIELTQQKR